MTTSLEKIHISNTNTQLHNKVFKLKQNDLKMSNIPNVNETIYCNSAYYDVKSKHLLPYFSNDILLWKSNLSGNKYSCHIKSRGCGSLLLRGSSQPGTVVYHQPLSPYPAPRRAQPVDTTLHPSCFYFTASGHVH